MEHGARDDVLVDMGAGEPQPLILQGVGSVIPAARYAGVTLNRPGIGDAGARKLRRALVRRGCAHGHGERARAVRSGEGATMRQILSGRKSRRQLPAGGTSGWGQPQTTPNCWRPRKRGHAVNQRRRFGTCRYRTPHTPPEVQGGRFSLSRARRPVMESWPGTSGSRFRQRPKVWTWSVAPQAGVKPIMANPLAAFPNVILFNCSTQGTGRPTGRRHPRATAL